MYEIELNVELDNDSVIEIDALRDEITENEIIEYLCQCVKRGIHEKFEEIADE